MRAPLPVRQVPAYFSEAQREATMAAGRLAGLEVVRLIRRDNQAIHQCFHTGMSVQHRLSTKYHSPVLSYRHACATPAQHQVPRPRHALRVMGSPAGKCICMDVSMHKCARNWWCGAWLWWSSPPSWGAPALLCAQCLPFSRMCWSKEVVSVHVCVLQPPGLLITGCALRQHG